MMRLRTRIRPRAAAEGAGEGEGRSSDAARSPPFSSSSRRRRSWKGLASLTFLATTTALVFGPDSAQAFWSPASSSSSSTSSPHSVYTHHSSSSSGLLAQTAYKGESYEQKHSTSSAHQPSMMEKLRLSRQQAAAVSSSYERQPLPQSVVAWLDPDSLRPSSLAASIHQVAKEMTAAAQVCNGGKPFFSTNSKDMKRVQQKECERQRACEMELMHLLAVAERNVHTLSPEGVSTVINALSKLPPRVLRTIAPHQRHSHHQQSMPQLREQPPSFPDHHHPTTALLPLLLERTLELVGSLSPRCVATMVNSLARIKSMITSPYTLPVPSALLTALANQAQRNFRINAPHSTYGPPSSAGGKQQQQQQQERERFTPQGISNMINGLARLGHLPGREFLDDFCIEVMEMMDDMNPQSIANIMNGLGKLGYRPSQEFLEAFAARANEVLPQFNPQGLSNLLNGFARLNPPFHPGHEFLDAVRDLSYPRLNQYESRGLAALVHGFSTLGHHPGNAYLDSFSESMVRCLDRAKQGRDPMTGWTLSTVYNALARLDWRPGGGPLPGLWTKTSWSNGGSLQGRVDVAAAAPDLSRLDWRPIDDPSVASSQTPSSSLHEEEEDEEVGGVLTAAEVTSLLQEHQYHFQEGSTGSKQRQEVTGVKLWRATAQWLEAQGGDETRWGDVLEPQQLTQLLWSLAAMGPPIEAEDLFRRLLGAAIARLGRSSNNHASSTSTPSSASTKKGNKKNSKKATKEEEEEDINMHVIRQLRQVARFTELVLGWEGIQDAVSGGPAVAKEASMLEQQQATSSSLLHMEVLRLICRDLQAHEARTEVDDGVYVQDIVLMPNNGAPSAKTYLPVIVEVDGPPHFFHNAPRRARGDHRLKDRIMNAQTGLTNGGVVSVAWWEWVSRNRAQRQRMIIRKMVEVGVLDPSVYLKGVAALAWNMQDDASAAAEDVEAALRQSLNGYDSDSDTDEIDPMTLLNEEEDDEDEDDDDAAEEAACLAMKDKKQISVSCSSSSGSGGRSSIRWGREEGGALKMMETGPKSGTFSWTIHSSSPPAATTTTAATAASSPKRRSSNAAAAAGSSPRSYQRTKMERMMKVKKEELMACTVKELRDKLKKKGMPISGVKAHLVDRLLGRDSSPSPQAA